MKKFALLAAVALCAGVVFAGTPDVSPYAGSGVTANDYDAWGQLIRSFTLSQPTGVKTGAACIAPHPTVYTKLYITGAWTGFTGFGVYNSETGALIGTVSASAAGFRDGTGKCHLGTGYFVMGSGGPGPAYPVAITYTSSSPYVTLAIQTSPVIPSVGRGIAWDGTYYYATTGAWGSPVGVYTSAGSQVRTWPISSSILAGLYGLATRVPGDGYLYTWDQASGYLVIQNDSSGSAVRSFTVPGQAGGMDVGWSNGYLYCCGQTPNTCFVYDGALGFTNVIPKSLGRIKAAYR